MSTQQLNPYHDNTPIVTFQCAIHAMIFQHGICKQLQAAFLFLHTACLSRQYFDNHISMYASCYGFPTWYV